MGDYTIISGSQTAFSYPLSQSFQRVWIWGLSQYNPSVFCNKHWKIAISVAFKAVNLKTGNSEGRRKSHKQMHEPHNSWDEILVFYENPLLWKAICKASIGFAWLINSSERLFLSLLPVTEKWLTRDCVHGLIDSKFDPSHKFLSWVLRKKSTLYWSMGF